MNNRRLLSIIASLALACGFAGADTVKLKTGETITGTITAEDATSVTIEFAVEGTKGIKDERRFEKSEIASFQKDDPADKAWADLTKDIPTADLLGTSDYDVLVGKVDAFLAAHRTSNRAAEARRLLAALKEERSLVAAGGMKLDGKWITPEEYQREKFWVDGRIALKQMADLAKAGRRMDALRVFEQLEASHAGTTIHAKAVTAAIPVLRAYGGSLAEAIANHPATMNQRAKVLTTLPPEEKRKTEQLQNEEVAAHKARLEEDRKSGTKWLAMAAFDLDELKKAAATVEKEIQRLSALGTGDAEEMDGTLRQVESAIQEGRIDAAKGLLAQISAKAQSIPYIKELQNRAQAEDARAAAEKKAADEARAAAERAERMANQPPVAPPANEEPDPVKEGMNPVAKAVAESDLGKRVAGETTPPPPPPVETPPTPPADEPGSVVEVGDSPAPPAAESTARNEKPDPAPDTKEPAGKNLTPLLYVIAGVLVIALIGLLILPSLKKKPEEDTSVLEHRKKQAEAEELVEEEVDPEDPEARR